MSFVIAVSDGTNIKIAADGQVTKNNKATKHDFKKIESFYSAHGVIYIGWSGDVSFGSGIIDRLKCLPSFKQHSMNAADFCSEIQKIAEEGINYLKISRNDICNSFIIIEKIPQIRKQSICNIYLINLKEPNYYQIGQSNEKYFYTFLSSKHIDSELAEKIVLDGLYSDINSSLDSRLINIVKTIANNDITVNKNITIKTL